MFCVCKVFIREVFNFVFWFIWIEGRCFFGENGVMSVLWVVDVLVLIVFLKGVGIVMIGRFFAGFLIDVLICFVKFWDVIC